jgi:hypothetical protein
MIDYRQYNDYYRAEASQAQINQMEYRARGNRKFTFMLSITLLASYLSFNYIQEHSKPLILHISNILEASVTDKQLPRYTSIVTEKNSQKMTTEEITKVVELVLAQMKTEQSIRDDQPSMISFN